MICHDINGKKPQKEGIYVHIWLTHFAVERELTEHCKATIFWFFFKNRHWVGETLLPAAPTTQRRTLTVHISRQGRLCSLPWAGASQAVQWWGTSLASARDAGDEGHILGSERSLGGGGSSPLQCPCLENPMDGGTWLGYSPLGGKELDMTERLHSLTHHMIQQSNFWIYIQRKWKQAVKKISGLPYSRQHYLQ